MIRGTSVTFQLLLFTLSVVCATNPVVDIAGLGKVEGTTAASSNGSTIYSFFSIPYANAPKDELRFKMPEAHPPWGETMNCTQSGPACPQPNKFISPFSPNGQSGAVTTSEDCLHLDVHTKSISGGNKLPVFVFFHGGAFATGGSYSIKPTFLLDYDMVLVVPQFRLGPLGFLSLLTEDIPGNAGLLDQNMALQWVRDHIENFGGDPNQVTIGGQSTGAASAVLHMLSPLSQGLFHRVIAHGGTGIAHWAINEDPLPSALKFVETVNCNAETNEDIALCLQKKGVDELMNAYTGEDGNFLYPAVQNMSNSFINGYTFDILTLKNYNPVPVMAGFNKHEGMLYLEDLYKRTLEPEKLLNDTNFLKNELVGYISSLYDVPDSSGVLVDALTKRFFNNSDLGDFDKMFEGLVDLCGSSFVKGHVYRLVQFNSENSTCYLYAFNYYSKDHIVEHADISPMKDGVLHGDEMIYLFPQEGLSLDEEQRKVSAILTQLWANFITQGNPTPADAKHENIPEWEEFIKDTDAYLIIDNNGTRIEHGFRKQLTSARDDGLIDRDSGGMH